MKECIKCGSTDFLSGRCRPCRAASAKARYHANKEVRSKQIREWNLKTKYGIDLKDYDDLLEKQNGVCAICQKPPEEGTNLHVDHCHIHGHVRGLLHRSCNTSLGHFNDDYEIVQRAADYLRRSIPKDN